MMVLQDEDWQYTLKRFIGGLGSPQRGGKLLLIDPSVTPPLLRFGFDTKEKLIKWVKENVTIPKNHYWLDQEVINYKLGPARAGHRAVRHVVETSRGRAHSISQQRRA